MLAGQVVLAGRLPVRLEAEDPGRASALAALLRHAPRSAEAPAGRLRFVQAERALPGGLPRYADEALTVWYPEPGRLVATDRSGVTAWATAGEVVITAADRWADAAFRRIALYGLGHLSARHGWWLLHAAAVTTGAGAVLIVGDSGSGKSTLAAAALAAGWSVLADDVVAVRSAEAAIRVVGVGRPVAVPRPFVTDGFAVDGPLVNDPRGRVELAVGSLSTVEQPVAAVVAIEHTQASEARLRPLGRHDVLRRLLEASTSTGDPEQVHATFRIAGSLAGVPARRFAHAIDPSQRLAGAAAQLDALGRELGILGG